MTAKSLRFLGLLVLMFIGALAWANFDDPFSRKWFHVRTPHGKAECVAVLPKIGGEIRTGLPFVVYLHDSGGTLMTDGKELRQLAELGMVAVSLEYNQTNYAAFEEEYSALLDFLQQQPWSARAFPGTNSPESSSNNSVAWLGIGLGAQNQLRCLFQNRQPSPKLLVNLGGGWRDDLTLSNAPTAKAKTPVPAIILIRGEADDTFSADAPRKLSAILQTNGYAIDNIAIPGLRRDLGSDRALVFRTVGEQIKARLTPSHPQPEFASPKTIPFLACETPAFLWLGFWLLRWKRSQPAQPKIPLIKCDIALRVLAGVMAAWALAETAIHLLPPRMKVSDTTLSISRRKIVPPKWRDDFDTLARQPIWQGQKLATLLTHAELSHYCVYELINWKLPPDFYRDFVLSPLIPGSETELNWRRPLWEFYYPRIRKENTTEAAATIIARTLRERVSIWPGYDKPQGIETIWRDQITDERGFELIYVAVLRAVGVPGRLSTDHKTEFWDGAQWRPAPRPLIESLHAPKP